MKYFKSYQKNLLFLFFILIGNMGYAQWTQLGQSINGDAPYYWLGYSVSLSSDGKTMAMLARSEPLHGDSTGYVSVYNLDVDTWVQKGSNIAFQIYDDGWPNHVCLSGDGQTLALGFPNNSSNEDNAGSVRTYRFVSDNWEQIGEDLFGETPVRSFGSSIALSEDGQTLAIGQNDNTSNETLPGKVWVYTLVSGAWQQEGEAIPGENPGDYAGTSIDLNSDGNVLAISSPGSDANGSYSGQVRVFEKTGEIWVQIGNDINGGAELDAFGVSVSLSDDGQTVAGGNPSATVDGLINAGYVNIFKNVDGEWTQQGDQIRGLYRDWLGYSTSLSADGSSIAIGAPTHNSTVGAGSGMVKVYRFAEDNWALRGDSLIGVEAVDWFGQSVSLSNDGLTLAVGAPENDAGGNNAGQVTVFQFSTLGIGEATELQGVQVYPNPSSGRVTLEIENQLPHTSFSIYSLAGKTVYSGEINNLTSTIDLSRLADGMYTLKVWNENGIKMKKLILNK